MTQAPTPGPLDSESVKLLVKGDLLWYAPESGRAELVWLRRNHKDVLAVQSVRDPDCGHGDDHARFTLIGRPDADGWMPWSGGENPVPGQRVQWRTRNESDRVMSVSSNNLDWTHECRRGFSPVIAFRLARTAPVEASGSEREVTIKIGDDRIGPWRIWFYPPPIGARNCDWHYQHEDDDGSCGWMSGSCATREDCLEEIITQYEERGS